MRRVRVFRRRVGKCGYFYLDDNERIITTWYEGEYMWAYVEALIDEQPGVLVDERLEVS